MFTALFSFLGGSAFRMIWGEVTAFVSKRQDHLFSEVCVLFLQFPVHIRLHPDVLCRQSGVDTAIILGLSSSR